MFKKTSILKKVNNGETEFLEKLAETVEESGGVIYVNAFSEESSKQFFIDFNKALRSGQTLIPILIDSYGGAVDSLLFMMDLIESSPVPVATFAMGKAMSCGSILLTSGTKGMRFIAPSARVMIHNVSALTYGKQPDVQVSAEEMERIQTLAFQKMAKNCGKKKDYFLNLMKARGHTDWYLTPQECKKQGLVDHIKVPTFSTSIVIQNVVI